MLQNNVAWLLLLFVVEWGHSAIISVSPQGPITIQAAVAAANAGDSIYISAGLYGSEHCDIFVDVDGLSLIGTDTVILDCAFASRGLTVAGVKAATISGIQIKNGIAPALMMNRQRSTTTTLGFRDQLSGERKRDRSTVLPRRRAVEIKKKIATIELFLTPDGKIEGNAVGIPAPKNQKLNRYLHAEIDLQHLRDTNTSSLSPPPLPYMGYGGCIFIYNSTVTMNSIATFSCKALSGAGMTIANSTVQATALTAQKNIVNAAGSSPGYGGGALFLASIVSISNSDFSFNQIVSLGNGDCLGGGAAWVSCPNLKIANISALNNLISATFRIEKQPYTYLTGGGLGFLWCNGISISGNIQTSSNQILSFTVTFVQHSFRGGGLGFHQCTSIYIPASSAVTVTWNAATAANKGAIIYGGGMSFFLSNGISLLGSGIFSRNSVMGVYSQVHGTGVYFEKCNNGVIGGYIRCSDNFGSGNREIYGSFIVRTCNYFSFVGMLVGVNNTARGLSDSYGGALFVVASNYIKLSGSILAYANNIWAAFNRGTGAGIAFVGVVSLTMDGTIVVQNNTVNVAGSGKIFGVGIFFNGVTNLNATGSTLIENNRGIANEDDSAVAYRSYDGSTSTCNDNVIITYNYGYLQMGISDDSGVAHVCRWYFAPPTIYYAFYGYTILMTMFDVVDACGSFWLFDGPTTASPLFGVYTGTIDDFYCDTTTGTCPSLQQPINTTTGTLTVMLESYGCSVNGFSFNFSMHPVSVVLGDGTNVLPDMTNYAGYAVGGGIGLNLVQGSMQNFVVRNNRVHHPIFAGGGGVGINKNTGKLVMRNMTIEGNEASAITTTGGGIAVFSSGLEIYNSTISANSVAIMYDHCYYSVFGFFCQAGFGGNFFMVNSAVNISSTVLSKGGTSCQSGYEVYCMMYGGGIAAIGSNSVLAMTATYCTSMNMSCEGNAYCGWSVGGCLYSNSATIIMNGGGFSYNWIPLIGSGGAVYFCNLTSGSFYGTVFLGNLARQGGGLALTDFAAVVMVGCRFERNIGTSIAGALSAKEDSTFSIIDSSFINNIASRASAFFSYNDNNLALYYLKGIKVVGDPGVLALLLGALNFSSDMEWACSWPGSVFVRDFTQEFYSLNCLPCAPGTYAVDAASTAHAGRKCLTCPYGGTCNGSTIESNGLMALGGFWGVVNDNAAVDFYPCPQSYCCPVTSKEGCAYNHCQGNRIGYLCGSCDADSGFRFFNEGCGYNSDCVDAKWAWPVTCLGAMCFAVVLYVLTGRPSSGLMSVILFFYQALPLVKNSPWKNTFPSFLVALQSIFTMSPSVGNSDTDTQGVCIVPSMTALFKISARLMFQGIVLLAVGFLFLLNLIIFGKKLNKMQFVAIVIRFLTIAYTSLVLTPLQMLQCVTVDHNRNVWWLDGSIECYQPWQRGAFAVMGILIPVPFVSMVIMWRWKFEESLSPWQCQIRKVLSNGYRRQRRWWLGVSLYRRLLLVLAFTMIRDGNWKSMAMTILCIAFIILDLIFAPFEANLTQKAETTCLGILAALSTTAAPQLSQLQFGSLVQISDEVSLEYMQFILAVTPISIWVVFSAAQFLMTLRQRMLNGNGIMGNSSSSGSGSGGNGNVITTNNNNFDLMDMPNHREARFTSGLPEPADNDKNVIIYDYDFLQDSGPNAFECEECMKSNGLDCKLHQYC